MAGQRPPYLVLAGICGVSVGAYALSLAAIARVQSEHDKTLIADREPAQEAIGLVTAHRSALSATLALARNGYEFATDDYDSLRAELDHLHDLLNAFGADIAKLDNTVAGLPSSIRLPAVPDVAPAPKGPPPTDGTTGASGKP
jgi:hypothetical protein